VSFRFNPPPNWPAPPEGWVPPPGWKPLPEWPAPPPGWQFWIADVVAGYVYIISNIGSFGENMIKIGMTRRLDPNDRVRELGDASVPFRFDVHAFIFSEDAVTLETQLHHSLEHCRVNQVNRRREFFRTSPADVLTLLEKIADSHLIEFTEIPEALEWRASKKAPHPAPAETTTDIPGEHRHVVA
jgi:hypothetical protein